MSEIVPGQIVKQLGSRIDASGNVVEKRPRKKVEIANDTWLVALKFLTGWENWTSMRFVSFQVNGVIENNASRLPLVVIENATTLKAADKFELRLSENFWNSHKAHSLQVLYHPVLFTRNVHLNVCQRDLSSTLSTDVSGHIRCGTFIVEDKFRNIEKFREYLSWAEHNVRADQIHFCSNIVYFTVQAQREELDAMSDFVFCSSHMCTKEMHILPCHVSERFLNTLVDKFRTISVIDSRIPTIVIIAYPGSDFREDLVSYLIEREYDNPFVYLITNGDNRMRISFCKRTPKNAMSDRFDAYVKFYTVWLEVYIGAAFFLIFLDKQQAQASTVIDPKSLSSPFSEPA